MTFKDKPKQMFSAQQLLEINSAAVNLANSAMFECGLCILGEERYVGQEEGALPVHIKQMLKVIPLKYVLQVLYEKSE